MKIFTLLSIKTFVLTFLFFSLSLGVYAQCILPNDCDNDAVLNVDDLDNDGVLNVNKFNCGSFVLDLFRMSNANPGLTGVALTGSTTFDDVRLPFSSETVGTYPRELVNGLLGFDVVVK